MKKQMTMVEAVNEWLREPFLSEPQRQFYRMYLENEGHKKIVVTKIRQLGAATFKRWLEERTRKIAKDMILNEMQPSEERIRQAAKESAEDQNKMVEEARKITGEGKTEEETEKIRALSNMLTFFTGKKPNE